jgi:RNA polymerase sigma-70 factor (ECF subfamily)
MGSPPDARVEFCEREYPRLVGGLTLYTSDRELSRELAQEALARACQHWGRVRRMDAPGAWVWRVALNLANRSFARRRAQRRAEHALGQERVATPGDPDEAVAVRAAVVALPKRQRVALVLRYFADLPVREVARLMRCREGTVKALTHQGIANLRQTLMLEQLEEALDGN